MRLAAISLFLCTVAEAAEPDVAFRRGSELVDRHCGECMGATVEGLQEGIDALNEALKRGYSDPAAAHRLLRDAYATMVYAFDIKRYEPLRRAEIAELVRIDPSDVGNRLLFIHEMPESERLSAVRALVKEYPDSPETRYVLAHHLFDEGQWQEGLKHGKRWLALVDPEKAALFSMQIHNSIRLDDLRQIVAADPSFHPSQTVLAVQFLGTGKTAEGLLHARLALKYAPPVMAAEYFKVIAMMVDESAVETLRREFADKLREGHRERG